MAKTRWLGKGVWGLVPLSLVVAMPAAAIECGAAIAGWETLERDLICSVDPALTIDGGRLDLNGNAVVCAGTREGVIIEGEGARLTNGAVTGCEVAVVVAGSGGHVVERVVASGSIQGMLVASDGNQITDNAVLRGTEDAAIQVDGSDNSLTHNQVAGSLDQGFEIRGERNLIARNQIGGISEGVEIRGSGNLVRHNEIIGATDAGVEVRADGNEIAYNRIADGAADGIALRASGNLVRDNAIYGSGDEGVLVFEGALGNTIAQNRVLGSATTDLVDQNPNCDDNDWRDNLFATSESDDCVD